jgi:hypothetical protein
MKVLHGSFYKSLRGIVNFASQPDKRTVIVFIPAKHHSMPEKIKYALLAALLALTLSLHSQTFIPVDPGFDVAGRAAAAWADMDNDGDADIFVTGLDEAGNAVANFYRNDGGGVFMAMPAAITALYDASCSFGDLNNDGLADLALTGYNGSGPFTMVYRNDGNFVFTAISSAFTNLTQGSVAWADYDNDGLVDLVVCGYDAGGIPHTILYRNNGDESFTDAQAGLAGLGGCSAAWADLDLDGDLDLAIIGTDDDGNYRLYIYLNDEASFSLMGAGLSGLGEASLAWGDYNNDSYPDLLVSGLGANGLTQTFIYRNSNGQSFVPLTGSIPGICSGSALWGDFDNDGLLDFIITGRSVTATGNPPPPPASPVFLLYRNLGGDQFEEISPGLPAPAFNAVVCADYDNDSDLDLFLAGDFDAAVNMPQPPAIIYQNQVSQVNNPPSAPTGLSHSLDGNSVQFSWNPSTDDHTPAAGLNYNLRIGTETANQDIFSALAGLPAGYRRLAERGNTGGATEWEINGFAFGEYYASVQAIDPSYAGSAFSGILIFGIAPSAGFSLQDSACVYDIVTITYTGNASASAQYIWGFDGGQVLSGSGQGPYEVYWISDGMKEVSLTVIENGATSATEVNEIYILGPPDAPGPVTGEESICQGTAYSEYAVEPVSGAASYEWGLYPGGAGTINWTSVQAIVEWSEDFTGDAHVFVRCSNSCGTSNWSDSLLVVVSPLPAKPALPAGPEQLCQNPPDTEYTTSGAAFGAGYQWALSPATAGNITGTGLTAGVEWDDTFTGMASIRVRSFNNCGTGPWSDSLLITISEAPLANAGEDQSIPQGTSTQLNGTASGGSGNYSFYWSPPGLLNDPAMADPTTVELFQSTQFTLTVTDELSGCTSADKVIVTVTGGSLALEASADPEILCEGSLTQLLALAGGGTGNYTYIWTSDPPGFTSEIADPMAGPLSATWYFVLLNDGNDSLTDSVFVDVIPLPVAVSGIEGPQDVCAGDMLVLYHAEPVPGAEKYKWLLPDGAYGGSDSSSILVNYSLQAVNGNLQVRPQNACGMGPPASLYIEIEQKPAVPQAVTGPDTVCTTMDTLSNFMLDMPVPGALSYEWRLLPDTAGSIAPDGLTAVVHWVKNWEGEAAIILRATNNCGNSAWSSPKIVIAYNSLGTTENVDEATTLRCYPNPTGNTLYVEYARGGKASTLRLSVYDLYGRERKVMMLNESQGMIEIDVSFFTNGLYILVLRSKHGELATAKFIVYR